MSTNENDTLASRKWKRKTSDEGFITVKWFMSRQVFHKSLLCRLDVRTRRLNDSFAFLSNDCQAARRLKERHSSWKRSSTYVPYINLNKTFKNFRLDEQWPQSVSCLFCMSVWVGLHAGKFSIPFIRFQCFEVSDLAIDCQCRIRSSSSQFFFFTFIKELPYTLSLLLVSVLRSLHSAAFSDVYSLMFCTFWFICFSFHIELS